MIEILRMGLKPLKTLYSSNPFTTRLPDGQEVNGNFRISLNFVAFLLPSALADGFRSCSKSWL
jgi:hypothetical protein